MKSQTVKKIIRIEYYPVSPEGIPQKVSSRTETYFHLNSMIKEEIREDFAPYSRMSIKRYYDEEWNIIDEAYYENDELVTTSNTITSGLAISHKNEGSFKLLPSTNASATEFSFIFGGKKTIWEERNPKDNLLIKRVFSKQVKDMKYIKDEIYEYF
jgi:hypothetical protein